MQKHYDENELIGFLDYAVQKGLLNENTATSRKIAVQKILSALDTAEKQDLRNLDREAAFHRFVNKLGKSLSPGSLSTYKSRFNKALNDFVRWAENPAGFKIDGAPRTARAAKTGADGPPLAPRRKTTSRAAREADTASGNRSLIVFPVPIRDGLVVQIHNLPSDLTVDEAKRIAAVVNALAVGQPEGK